MKMLRGTSLIGVCDAMGGRGFRAIEAQTGIEIEPEFAEARPEQVRQACTLAADAFDRFRDTSPNSRASFLECIADEISAIGDPLIERAMMESGLPEARLRGERDRTTGQLRLFANVLREGRWLGAVIERALPDRAPAPRPRLAQRRIALGPVAVFGASNFPLAFSVAGGDTASAFAAGCPVVVKGHPAHPGTSELVGRAVRSAVVKCGLPEGVFSLLQGRAKELGRALVMDPDIKAVGFTGSRGAGLSLCALAASRPEPIPVFAEMSSVNPVLLFPGALAARPEALAKEFVGSLTQGAGQFCTCPGIVLACDGPALQRFLEAAGAALNATPGATMLTQEIHAGYEQGVRTRDVHPALERIGSGGAGPAEAYAAGALHAGDVSALLADRTLQDELFGASALVMRCRSTADFHTVLESMEGQLTVTLHIEPSDEPEASALIPLIERRAGRILANGWPTGVEVSRAIVHGGPFPATSDSRSTSVGTAAIERFLRPVCYQGLPEALLPPALRSSNPWNIPRTED